MLHVILTILKIIGILLLVVIALVILLVLAVLLAPVNYQFEGAYTDESKKGDVRLTWLLHFLSVHLSYDLSNLEGGVRIKILGIDPRKVSRFFKNRKKKKKKKTARPEKRPESENRVKQEKPQPTKEKESGKEEEKPQEEIKQPKEEPEANPKNSKKDQDNKKQKNEGEKKKTAGKRHRSGKKESLYDRVVKFFKKQVYKLQGICDRIEKIRDSRGILRETRQKAARLLHHYRVRKGTGFLQFGTGDPAATAELTGFLYILLPASCGDIRIDPQFTDAAFQMDLSVRGHIRLIHLLRAVLWGVFNKDLRQLISEMSGS